MKDVHISAGFPTGSAGEISLVDDVYVILPKPEPVPEWFFAALQENFGGAGVPREYAFHVRVVSGKDQSVRLRFPFTATNGSGYMDPPYWIRRDGVWCQETEFDTVFEARKYAEVTVAIGTGETVQVANKPYPLPKSIYTEIDELVRWHPFMSSTVYGETADGRPLVAL
jgi:hypothetical protein